MGLFSGMKWYDYIWAPWTLAKASYLAYKNSQPPKPGRMPQTSCYGRVLPLVWGKTRISGNLIYQATEVYGLISNPVAGVSIPALVAICEGEINSIPRAWRGGKVLNGSALGAATYRFNGTRPTQTAWSALPAGRDLGYPGVAMVGADWNAIAKGIGDWSFEVAGLEYGTGDASTGDADPVAVVEDALGTAYYAANFTPTIQTATGVDGVAASSYARWVAAMALWVSPAWTEQKPCTEHLRDLLDTTWADALWSDGKLKILPLGDQEVVGAVTFTPYASVRYALTLADLVRDGDADPVEVERGAESDVYNTAPVAFLDREPAGGANQAYNETTVEDADPYHSQTYGVKKAPRMVYDSVCLRDVAVKLARLRAQRWVQQRNTYSFSLPWRFCRLEPFDLVSIPVAGETKTVKILAVRESDDHSTLEIQAEDWLAGANTANAHTVQSSDGATLPLADLQTQLHEKIARTWNRVEAGNYTPGDMCWHQAANAFLLSGAMADSPYTPTVLMAGQGEGWSAVSTSPGTACISLASDGVTAVGVTTNYVATSTTGDVWTAIGSPPTLAMTEVVSAGVGNFAAMGTAGAYYSANSGATWAAATGWPATFNVLSGAAYSPDTGRIIAVGRDSSEVPLYTYSDDNGATWSAAAELPSATMAYYYDIVYGGGRWTAVGTKGSYAGAAYSTDNGATWTEDSIGNDATGALAAVAYTGRIMVGVRVYTTRLGVPGSYAMTSNDGGDTWTVIDDVAFPEYYPNAPVIAWGPAGGAMFGQGSAYMSSPVGTY